MDSVQSYEAWLLLRFLGNPALNPELQAKIKDIDLLKWSALSDTQFYEKNLSAAAILYCLTALKPMPGDGSFFLRVFFHLQCFLLYFNFPFNTQWAELFQKLFLWLGDEVREFSLSDPLINMHVSSCHKQKNTAISRDPHTAMSL